MLAIVCQIGELYDEWCDSVEKMNTFEDWQAQQLTRQLTQERVDDNDLPPHDYYNEGSPPSGDPDWGPPDAYGYDWSDDDERHVPNYQWSVELDLRTWNCRGHVRARVRVIDESGLADYENELNINREVQPGYGGRAGEPSSAHTAAGAPSSAGTAAGEPSRAHTAAGEPSSAHTAAGKLSVREEQLAQEQQAGLPPHLRDEAYNHEAGSAHFHSDRAEWYKAFTGKPLVGSIAEQSACFDVVARRFRKYSDGRTAYPAMQHTAPSSACTAAGVPSSVCTAASTTLSASATSSAHTAAGEPSSVHTAADLELQVLNARAELAGMASRAIIAQPDVPPVSSELTSSRLPQNKVCASCLRLSRRNAF